MKLKKKRVWVCRGRGAVIRSRCVKSALNSLLCNWMEGSRCWRICGRKERLPGPPKKEERGEWKRRPVIIHLWWKMRRLFPRLRSGGVQRRDPQSGTSTQRGTHSQSRSTHAGRQKHMHSKDTETHLTVYKDTHAAVHPLRCRYTVTSVEIHMSTISPTLVWWFSRQSQKPRGYRKSTNKKHKHTHTCRSYKHT